MGGKPLCEPTLYRNIIDKIIKHNVQSNFSCTSRASFTDTLTTIKNYINIKPGLILGLRPANERRRYKVAASLIGWAET